jgi:hypothetical protein
VRHVAVIANIFQLFRRQLGRLRFQLLASQGELGLLHQRAGNVLLFRAAPRQAIAGRDRVKARVRGVPIDRQADPRRIVGRELRHRADQHRIDSHGPRQPLEIRARARLDAAGQQQLLGHAHRHHLEAGNRLQLVVVGQRDLFAIDGWLGALVIKRQHRHAMQLRERIVILRLDPAIRKGCTPCERTAG